MGENENISSKKENTWRTLKLKNDVFEAFEEIKDALKAKHGKKSISNSDTMQFLLYLAKVALELEGNPRLEGVAEPLDYDVLMKLERYSQSIADSFGIPIEYVRGGVLWGILEVTREEIQKDWKKAKYYLKLAQSWVGEYSFHLYEDEISKVLSSIIEMIPETGQGNRRREEIHEKLFENVENLVGLIFSTPNVQIFEALVRNEMHVRKWGRVLNVMKTALSYNGPDDEKIIGLIGEFIKRADKELDPETLEEYIMQLTKAAESLSMELRIIETAAGFIDVRSLYEEILKRRYLLPEDRLEVSRSMILAASKTGDIELLNPALEVAKKELETLRRNASPGFELKRRMIAETLGKAGFWDTIIDLKFDDEVPGIGYHRLRVISAMRKDFERGWKEFESLTRVICSEKCAPGVSSDKLFLPGSWGEELSECFKELNDSGADFKKLRLVAFGSVPDLKVAHLDILCRGYEDTELVLRIPLGEKHTVIPSETVLKLIVRLLESGITVDLSGDKIMITKLLSEKKEYLEISKGLVEEAINKMNPNRVAFYLKSPEFVKLLKDAGVSPLETFKKALKGLPEREYDPYNTLEGFITTLVFEDENADEVFDLIEEDKLLDALAEVIEDRSLRYRLGLSDLKRLKQNLINYFIEAYMKRNGYALTARFVLERKLKTSLLPYLVDGLLREGNIGMADKLASEFGLGWFGVNNLKILLEFRFEKCISEFKNPKKGEKSADKKEGEELSECYKTVLSLLRASKRYTKPEDYGPLAGKYAGRLLVWRVFETENS
ncbi:hypothetical protein [Thermococcus sp.]|uniref:hypothetical protein n=1 Tax=Thermococcus sp. TaxID=35749 RepID=UPI0025F6BA1E|nr:hypothetical protein [Thermococcus sp.]